MNQGKLILTILISLFSTDSFKEQQLKQSRVAKAYEEKEDSLKKAFTQKKINYTGLNLFIRAFKQEQQVEVWIKESGKETFTLFHTYDFCATSGALGPKRKEGDLQIPEGFYHINHFNPQSIFHLSLGINYPNASDKILSDKKSPGSSIYIHGDCVTIGCIPITDDKIKELYVLAVEARNNGQAKIPVHIFPARLTEENFKSLSSEYASNPVLISFWQNLKIGYDGFESTKKIRGFKVNSLGDYY